MPSPNESVPAEVVVRFRKLVDGFSRNAETLRTPAVNEATVRSEFIDEFWAALGWDVANFAHRTQAERDVVVEPPVRGYEPTRLTSRRPDYIFRIDGFPRFIVEAKKPWVDIKTDRDAVFQAKSYAWSAQIPFAVLTNFERFRLFDATTKPLHSDPEGGLVADFDLSYSDYLSVLDTLHGTFSRDAVASGSLEKLLARIKRVRRGQHIRRIDRMLIDLRGSEPVDKVFLAHLEDFRLRLARSLYAANRTAFPDTDSSAGIARLAEAAQRIIDRLVFLRVCEDRGISEYGSLGNVVNECAESGADLADKLSRRFRDLDVLYNGYLFKPHFSEELRVDAQVIADFIRSLYPPEAPYRFDAFSDDVLGIVYERFLGSVLRVTSGQVQAEQKAEVRHAGGVYYTPRFAVNTIVRRTIGPQIKGRNPQEVLKLRILDPACGSGSFLIAAYQFLVDHCVKFITEHPEAALVPVTPRARKKKKEIAFQDEEGQWHLSPDFRSALLTSCLYGVDIDPQAVEVTIMSLYLKMLEEELPPHWQRQWLEDQLLPPLDGNIRCGNSLLSPEDLDEWWVFNEGGLFDGSEELRYRMNPFDWSSPTLGFGRVIEAEGGFDCIIGNPPYIRVQELQKWAPDECEFYKWRFNSASANSFDIYVVFIERCLELLKPGGLLGFICPHKYWVQDYGETLRTQIALERRLRSLIDFTDQQVFTGASTYTAIQVLGADRNDNGIAYARVVQLTDGDSQCRALDAGQIPQGAQAFQAPHPENGNPWYFHDEATRQVLHHARKGSKSLFPDVCENVFQGIITGCDPVFLSSAVRVGDASTGTVRFHSEVEGREVELEAALVVPVVRRDGFQPFWTPSEHGLLLPYDRNAESLIDQPTLSREYPRAWEYLSRHKTMLAAREKERFKDQWWALSRAQNIRRWSGSKVMVPYMVNRLSALYDTNGRYFVNVTTGGYGLELRRHEWPDLPRYVVGLLSSSLLDFLLRSMSSYFQGGYFPANKQFIQHLPIRLPTTNDERERAVQVVALVKDLEEFQRRRLSSVLGENERTRLERQMEATRNALDKLVLNIYELDSIPSEVT